MQNIYEFTYYAGRGGTLEGMFFAKPEDVEAVIGANVQFGEALGKHSEVTVTITEDMIKLLTDDQDFITKAIPIFGDGTISGYNPITYYKEQSEEDYEEDDE